MKTIATILFLILQMTFVFGQSDGMIFPSCKDKIIFKCPRSILLFADDENDSLDITPSISFYIDRTPIILDNTFYYKFYLSEFEDSSCTGYLSQDNKKIFTIPYGDSIRKSNEKLLFDFNTRRGTIWETNALGVFSNNKMKYKKKYYNKGFDEYLYVFEIVNAYPSGITIQYMIVGEKNGIVGVNYVTHYGGSCIECKK